METKGTKDYFLGFDIGTESVGYAVTDEKYNILKFNGKSMWGSRLFDVASPAADRRLYRTNRRRLQRRSWRIQLLQELFAEEICKVDAGFFQRMKDSGLLAEDKETIQSYALFSDPQYNDVDFHKEFPTIYHLRKALITENRKYDVRLVYLAVHHIVKHRGHFLFHDSVENATSFIQTYENLKRCLKDEFGIELECSSVSELAEVLRDKRITKKDKCNTIMGLLSCEKSNKQLKGIIGLICGLQCKLAEVFEDETLSESERPSISFSKDSYEDIRPALEVALQERCSILDLIKSVYDWAILADILAGGEYEDQSYLSVAKVKKYEKHKLDLEMLKKVIEEYDREVYRSFFKIAGKDNYCAYVGSLQKNGKKMAVKKCSREDFIKAVKKLLQEIKGKSEKSKEIEYIEKELENDTFLPLQVSKDNGVIPYQVHGMELKKILSNAEKYLPFLGDADEDGIQISEKIIKLFEFRIPYYVGPLGAVGEHRWMIRKKDGVITPWNFDEMVDVDKSAEKFIRKMTNKCTYLLGKDVLPKNSLLYSEFMVWNELNNVKIDDKKLPIDMKQSLFDNLFKEKRRITGKMLRDYLRNEGVFQEGMELSGFDNNFKSALISYLDFKKIFGEKIEQYSVQCMVENIILWSTLYGEEPKMLKRVIRGQYSIKEISDEQLGKICRLKYQGWGRLSKEFLTQMEGADKEIGEIQTIIQALRNTNDNLMQLLSQRYTYSEEVKAENQKEFKQTSITYDELIKNMVVSPAIKRAVWQVVSIAEEIRKIMGKEPKKIFVEMARGPEEKKRTISRKNRLIELYSNCKKEEREWKKELESHTESDFRSIKLYLYYTQKGRCMYSGEPIDLSQLYDATVYDRDHIYPQSKTKDDSLDNLVLVKRDINEAKRNDVLSIDIQKKMAGFWFELKTQKLISEEKYNRLMRKTQLTDEELAGFINRQLVETRQSSKIVLELFKQIYKESKGVYVKSGAVSEFRNEFKKKPCMVKVREMNDYHHAKDAYLNIVVGNVYNEKFTDNPLEWLKKSKDRNYSLNQMFNFNLSKNGKEIWVRGNEGTIAVVEKYMRRNDIRYTRYAATNKGELFDQQPKGKEENPSVPRKKGMEVTKYGGYKSRNSAYFALVESEDKKGQKQRSIEAVPLYLVWKFENEKGSFEQYCIEEYGLKNPRIIIPKIKKNAYMIVGGFPMHLRGTTGKQLTFQGAVQLCLEDESARYLKKVEKYIQRNLARTDKKNLLPLSTEESITVEKNVELYDILCRKQKDTIYQYRPASQYQNLVEGREKFIELCCEEQCIVLNEVLHLLQCKPITANLTLIGGSGLAGTMKVGNIISKNSAVRLIHQSVTGLFEQEIDLLTV